MIGSLKLSCCAALAACLPCFAATAPSIASGGIVNGASYVAGVTPTSWITILGANLVTSTVTAASTDLVSGYLPTTLGGASVTIDGRPAYMYYASPTQLNVESPTDPNSGTVTVVVTTSAGTGSATTTLSTVLPGLFSLGSYVAAVRPATHEIVTHVVLVSIQAPEPLLIGMLRGPKKSLIVERSKLFQ